MSAYLPLMIGPLAVLAMLVIVATVILGIVLFRRKRLDARWRRSLELRNVSRQDAHSITSRLEVLERWAHPPVDLDPRIKAIVRKEAEEYFKAEFDKLMKQGLFGGDLK